MRITIVTGPFLSVPPAKCGAVERRMSDLTREFVKKGHDVTLITRDAKELPQGSAVPGAKHRRLLTLKSSGNLKLNIAKDLVYSLAVLRTAPKADVLLTNTFWLPVLAPGLRPDAGRVFVQVARVPKGQMRYYHRFGTRDLIAVSSAIRDWIIAEAPAFSDCVATIVNPIDTSVFKPRESAPIRDKKVVYTGRVHPEKGLKLLIDAARQFLPEFPDTSVHIYGPWEIEDGGGGGGFVEELKRYASGLPVHFHEPIYDRARLANVLQEATVYVYPTTAERGEACPVAPLEAMATGAVTIVSALPQFRDYIEHERTGLVFDHEGAGAAKRLAAQVSRALSDPMLAKRLSAEAAKEAGARTNASVAESYLQRFHARLETAAAVVSA